MTRRRTAALVGVVAISFVAPARAQLPPGPHFTFTVPVRLVNLPPEIQRYSVVCAVTGAPGTGIMARGETIQRGSEGVAIAGGSLNTDVVVNVTVTNPLLDPGTATDYVCNLFLMGVAPPGSPPSGSITWLDDSNTRFPLDSRAPFRKSFRGPIPH